MTPYGALIVDPLGLRLSGEEKRFFADVNPFGFILFGRNLDNSDQIRGLCADLRDAVGWDAPITIDQEGGRVQRLRAPFATEWVPPLDECPTPEAFTLRGHVIATELRALGIDSNCAPMLDIARDHTHPFLRNRCYGESLDTVVRLGRAMAEGLMAGGCLPVMKHIPGHGLSISDSHHTLPHVDQSAAELDRMDFAAFRALNDLPMGMTAHLRFEQIDPRPATLSPVMIDLIRNDIGFDGLLMTDDIGMKALVGTRAEVAAKAIAAGVDVVLHCNGDLDEKRAVADAAGQLSETGQIRAQAALNARAKPTPLDIPDALAKLAELRNGRRDG